MHQTLRKRARLAFVSLLAASTVVVAPFVVSPATANTSATGVVISEAYLNGGSSGASYLNKFVELYNPTGAAVDLSTMSLQYRSATGTANPTGVLPLTGSIAAKGHYLIGGTANAANGQALPAPDATFGVSFAGGGGTLFLAAQTTALPTPATGAVAADAAVVDVLGYGTSNTFEGQASVAASVTTSIARTNGVDTDNNRADFTAGAPTPQNAASDGGTTGVPDPDPVPPVVPGVPVAVADIQGSTDTSPLVGQTVTARGVVTASYPTGGFNGYYIQTPGTGGAVDLSTHTRSDGLFVFSAATVAAAAVGSFVEVTGTVAEFSGLTELNVAAGGLSVLSDTVTAPTPAAVAVPTDAAQRESLEGMLIAPAGDYTVTDNYDTNYYGSVVLVGGTSPLETPTAVVAPGSAEYTALVASNLARSITLDDGASLNFNSAANKSLPLPYLSVTNPVRIGAGVNFTAPVVLDYRFGTWNLQPTEQLTAANQATVQPATFTNTRTASPADVGGDVTMASFNVLNYFTTTGDSLTGCTYYTDRDGNPTTVNSGCDARGAANADDLARQQAKIVSAINALGADVVSLEEIENSARFGENRDAALSTLTAALNSAAGAGTWAFVASPAAVPASEDVIRTAFIYKPAVVSTVGSSVILDDPAFANARQPLAQAFTLVSGADESRFLAIVNHFKSKGSGTGADADTGDGQGASNASRVKQAKALVGFADTLKASTGIDRVLLDGDFNAYLKEDPIAVLTEAGYTDLGSTTGKQTYAFDGATGSLDHIFASSAATAAVTGVDVWNINSVESIALEYSRFNYNATDFYQPNAYRSSDHDPLLVGLNLTGSNVVDINLLNINDFHGRIDSNTVKFAGTIEKLKAEQGDASTLFLSDGDNIGASLFASSSQKDQPTIDVLNTLGLTASAVGNHEFDQGFADLTGRVTDAADWDYLGANVYLKGTTTPALQQYKVFTVNGVRVAVVGAVTEETPTLVSPGGISTLDFGDPVDAVNRVVTQLKAADAADVFIAEYHEGASAGTPDGATLAQELALTDTAFAKIVTQTTPDVAAIFTGHTHKQYAWDAAVPGSATATRPVLQTGSYGENIGQIILSVDKTSDAVVTYTAKNVPRVTTADADLVAAYPRVAEVKSIVDAALAKAAVIGNQPIGTITADITTAYTNGTTRDDRGSESTLGNLVADSLVSSLSDPTFGGAEIGVVNPGGLRSDLLYASSPVGEGNGVVTYAEANAVLPFVNNLWTTTLTGAQFKTILEQQWQTDAAGAVPSRPYLALGLSNNVDYTYDAARAQGDHITGITVGGVPIDPAKGYRIGSFSFLLQGGDNFREFTAGANTRDSGLIDRDAWINYLTTQSPVSPAFDRRGVSVTDVPTSALAAGTTAALTLSKLDLTSLGSPLNTSVSASFEGSAAAPVVSPVSGGVSTVAFAVPSDVPADATLVIVAAESGTTVRVPITVGAVVTPDPTTPTTPETPAPGQPGAALPGAGTPGSGSGSDLANTGNAALPALLLSALLLLAGAGLVLARRRRSATESVDSE
ncbi:ExeM/NucH family extracellular endonuclease [Subtercola sp. RTI3]|uniref:ExeM/NucH family extracellular endonuclease n=1 Tax=Subtercola sp. RTI3 TaxID=3048639 RepID=UPI002B223E5D|nr:ExeM/NucH family extracellular endonuclease [Subtercola sp. RTI3]MEA9985508.1 ExeM/NucH family extracellular endonuclease [Subtercola sp. RTI3]